MHKSELIDWVPLKTFAEEDDLLCQWLYTGGKKFTEPFFDDTIRVCKRLPENSRAFKSSSTLEMLPYLADGFEPLEPTAFIFHVSRCGSTLLAQLLGINPAHVVLSEVPFLDEILRLPYKAGNNNNQENINRYFRAALQLYTQKSDERVSRLFVKSDSWHLFFYEEIRELFPDTPFIFLYRSPAEIIRSQKKQRGLQSIPGMIERELFGFKEEDITFDLDVYMARVLEKYFSKLFDIIHMDTNFILCNYAEGMENILEKVLSAIGLQPDEDERRKMEERMGFDGKRPQFFYEKEIPETSHAEYLTRCMKLYKEVEEKRQSLYRAQNEFS